MEKKLLAGLATGLFMFGTVLMANAATVFSNYGNGDTHSTSGGWGALYNVQPPYYPTETDWDVGMTFTPTDNYYLDTIEITADLVVGGNQLDVWLMTSSNNMPGNIIETFNLSDSMDVHTWNHHDPIMINSVLNPILNADTPYWLAISTPTEGTDVVWFKNSVGQIGPRALWNGSNWSIANNVTPAVFRVSGSPVPILGAIWLLGSGLAGVVALRRRKKN